MSERFLSTTEVAARLGITRAAVSKYDLPQPDAMIGAIRGWLPETIDHWQAQRPGQGYRSDKARNALPQP